MTPERLAEIEKSSTYVNGGFAGLSEAEAEELIAAVKQPSKQVLKAVAVIAAAVPFSTGLNEEERQAIADHMSGVMDAIEGFDASKLPVGLLDSLK